jgi:uracil phosphoribosyltransferase
MTAHLSMTTAKNTTPICEMDAPVLKGQPPVIVPILRAGLGMSVAFDHIMPEAPVGHIGLYRDPETKQPVEYLVRLPQLKNRDVILADPMLATGFSAAYAIGLLMRHGAAPANIRMMCLVAAPEGVEVVAKSWPDVAIFTAALDSHLNENAYIVPGLGDAGDRLFGTDHH